MHQPLLNIAINAARQAGDVITRHMDQLDHITITAKGLHDYFSEVDVKAEHVIMNAIRKAYPDHGFIAEESGVHNDDAETVWIIDPIDGTHNFLHGFPFFSVSIAVRIKNRIEHGVVYDPLRHECFSASRGRGARLNDRRLRVSKKTQLNEALVGTGFTRRDGELTQAYFPLLENITNACASIRRTGSAALDLAYVASGRLDAFWQYNLRLWDIAAGALLVQEAGGLVSDPEGGETYLDHGSIVAGTPKVFKGLLQTIASTRKTGAKN